MFNKVLVVEDLDSIGYGISTLLKKEIKTEVVTLSQYCDDAYAKFQKALLDQQPYDLIITDLSFEQDYRQTKIRSGEELLIKLKGKAPNTPIIVYSIETRPLVINRLIEKHGVYACIGKGRRGLSDILTALQQLQKGQDPMNPRCVSHAKTSLFELTDYDVQLLTFLAQGLSQEEISVYLKAEKMRPSSLSSIEKRLNLLKDGLKAKNTIQLVAQAKDLGVI
jgi:DNA-binding NarL/FixJ family response regulator